MDDEVPDLIGTDDGLGYPLPLFSPILRVRDTITSPFCFTGGHATVIAMKMAKRLNMPKIFLILSLWSLNKASIVSCKFNLILNVEMDAFL